MRIGAFRARALAALCAALLASCSSRNGGPYPTLEDYSDGTSRFAEELLDAWKKGTPPDAFFDPSLTWSGPLPGDGLSPIASRPPLALAGYQAPAARGRASGAPALSDADVAPRALGAVRSRFTTLGRCEATLFDMRRRGEDREVLLHVLLSGKGHGGELRQEGGKLRLVLSPASREGEKPAWRIRSGSVASWLSASAGAPLYEEVAERAGLTRRHARVPPERGEERPHPGRAHAARSRGPRLRRRRPPGPLRARRRREPPLPQQGRRHLRGRRREGRRGGPGGRGHRRRSRSTTTTTAGPTSTSRTSTGRTGCTGIAATARSRRRRRRPASRSTSTARPRPRSTTTATACRTSTCSSTATPQNGPTLEADNAPPNHLFRNNGDGTFTDVSKKTHTDDTRLGPRASRARTSTATAGRTSTSRTTSARTRTCTTAETARSRTRRRRRACSTRASAWASRWTTTTATAGPTSTSRTTRSR